jgi:hypothetical protein
MAMVSDSHKFVYVSGGRNATGAVGGNLINQGKVQYYEPAKKKKGDWGKYNKHMPARHIRKVVGEEVWNNYFKFTYVRNTYSWVISSIGFWFKIGMLDKPEDGYLTMDHFKYAVKYYRTPAGRRHDECSDIRSQHSFICNKNGKIIVDFVGRFEHLQEDFYTICSKVGLPPIELTLQNSSMASSKGPHSTGIHWTEHYTRNPEAQEFVYQNWKRDIDAFDFKLEV